MGIVETILAKFLGSKVALLAGGAAGGLLARVAWPHIKRIVARETTARAQAAIKGILDKQVTDPVLKEKLRKATLANVELIEYLVPDRGQGAEKKARVQDALRRVFPQVAADLIADVIEEAVYASDEVFKGTLETPPAEK